MTEDVILVDEQDIQIGTMEKMEAHEKGLLHRAVSVFIFNSLGEVLLQRRADTKYHSAGLWTNTACTHPFPSESALKAATRRLQEEMGMTGQLHPAFEFTYHAKLEHGLAEHEYDHVFIGISDQKPKINPKEVGSFDYKNMIEIQHEISLHPEQFTEWFKLCFRRAFDAHVNLNSTVLTW
ncbi:MAG: isopentenyl-diphosphate Delta-isomerase [Flavobacteriales bacterium]|jgi:isopentenyl-diphosphate Delta-isomerase|nr:isopentenyl-diphosphate Delta-isomerase [Flavobacteriales bacterium]NCG29104.1 isopentenyl-diphosphate Delta-isomerase [Bacteroidota bacterium]